MKAETDSVEGFAGLIVAGAELGSVNKKREFIFLH